MLNDRSLDELLALHSRPVPDGWRRSKKGNLTAERGGYRMTVFRRGDGFRWSAADEDGEVFGEDTYETETDAAEAVEAQVGEWL
jgi:hypothetical protein